MMDAVIGSSTRIRGCEAVDKASAARSIASTDVVAATDRTLPFTKDAAVRTKRLSAFEMPTSGSSTASTPSRSNLRAISSFCLKDKVDFYLKHEEARQRIAINGYKTVSEKHNYSKRLDYILDKIF